MSDSVKKYYELVDEGVIKANTNIAKPKKAFRILTQYDIEDIKEAVQIYEKSIKQLLFKNKLVILQNGYIPTF